MAAPPAGTRFYTYKPGSPNVPAGRKGDQLVLKPGETVGRYVDPSGKGGYYAIPGTSSGAVTAPPASTPSAPVDTTPAVTQPATGGGTWKMPDYASLLANDWEPAEAETAGVAARGTAEAAFQKALREAFIDYGGDVGRLGDYAKYIDAPTIEAAKANKFSQTAQNLAAMTKSLKAQRAALAARGMEFSGANTVATEEALSDKEKADYAAMRDYLGGAAEGEAGLGKTYQDIADRIAAAKKSAADRIYQTYLPEWIADQAGGGGGGGGGESGLVDGSLYGYADDYTPTPAAPAYKPPLIDGSLYGYANEYTPSKPAPWAGITWGGTSGIKTKAQLIRNLAPGVTYAQWAANHPDAAARLT